MKKAPPANRFSRYYVPKNYTKSITIYDKAGPMGSNE